MVALQLEQGLFKVNILKWDNMNQKRFSNSATTYDLHAKPQQDLVEALVKLLPQENMNRILEVGSGTGLFTEKIHQKYPHAKIDAIDIAESMIRHTRKRFIGIKNINWIIADAEIFQASTLYDLIASSATLHWSSNLTNVLKNIHFQLKPGGFFVLGIMLKGTLWELRELRRMIAPEKGAGLILPPNVVVEKNIQDAGFSIQQQKIDQKKVIYDDTRSFLRAIHEQGVTSLPKHSNPLNRSELHTLTDKYQEQYSNINGVYATYETGQYLLKKPL